MLQHFRPRGLLRRLGYQLSRWLDAFHSDEEEDPVVAHALDVRDQAVCAFLGPQKHIATECCGDLDPLDLDEYLRHDGFVALRRCLNEFDPADDCRRSAPEWPARTRRRWFPDPHQVAESTGSAR